MPVRTPPKPAEIQYRMLPIATRAAAGDTEVTDPGFTGHTSVFGTVDAYGTALKAGAFTKTLQERGMRIPVLWQHDADNPIGKPIDMKEDETGLYVDASIVEETRRGAEAMALLRADVPLGLSIGFETIKSRRWEEADDAWLDWSTAPSWAKDPEMREEWVRIIEEVRLWEFSVVTFPANEQVSFDDIRSAAHLDLITTLTDDLQAGRIAPDDARHSSLTLLVAAYQERAGAGPAGTTPLGTAPARRRNRFAEATLLFGELGISL